MSQGYSGGSNVIIERVTDAGNTGTSLTTDATQQSIRRATVSDNFTLENPTNAIDGQKLVWELQQNGTGGFAVTYGSKFVIPSAITDSTISGTANETSIIAAIYNASKDEFLVTGVIQGYA